MKSFESFDHTADVGLRARGKDLKEVFAHAAEGLFDLIAEQNSVGAHLCVRPNRGGHRQGGEHIGSPLQIRVTAPSLEELLVAWLRELLYLSSTRQMVFWKFKIKRMNVGAVREPPLQIHAEISGEKIDPTKHILKKEVKAVTYHGLSLKKTRAGWLAEVILDV